MDTYVLLILLALFGFLALAALVLVPFHLFLQREKTRRDAARRARGNGR